MNSLIRVTSAVGRVKSASPEDCVLGVKELLGGVAAAPSDVLVFPKLALCPPSAGSLLDAAYLRDRAAQAMGELEALTAERDGYVVAGLVVDDFGKPVSVMAVLYRGELIGLIPTLDNPSPLQSVGLSSYLLPVETVFGVGDLRFCVVGCSLHNLATRVTEAAKTGCDLIIVPAYTPQRAGLMQEVREVVRALSRSLGVAIAVVNGGVGDTSSPHVYQGFACTAECGRELCFVPGGYEGFCAAADVDVEWIEAEKTIHAAPPIYHSIPSIAAKPGLLRPIPRQPFLAVPDEAQHLEELFDLQVRSLAARLQNSGLQKAVVGVSGGLDSTAALLVCAAAMDVLGLPRAGVVGVTMPGPGTSSGTHGVARQLMAALGVGGQEIPIGDAVALHLQSIGHGGQPDTVYENAQARERTQILFDLANGLGALVVGTGDMSEAALGFCTFGGDHLAGYNVNICLPKTVLRALVRHVAHSGLIDGVRELVEQVLSTPVSPELLPPDANGNITQVTEEIVGPYELHDFFLYHFLRFRLRPYRLYMYACSAFAGIYEPAQIKSTLHIFLRRLCLSQFKRSCAPDAAAICEPNLFGLHIPSDLDPAVLLRELDQIG